MNLSAWTDEVTIYARTAETDTWALVDNDAWPCTYRQMSPAQARRESALPEPDSTHKFRIAGAPPLARAQRLVVAADGTEYIVREWQTYKHPQPGHTSVLAAKSKATV